jgi:hypothetical protein
MPPCFPDGGLSVSGYDVLTRHGQAAAAAGEKDRLLATSLAPPPGAEQSEAEPVATPQRQDQEPKPPQRAGPGNYLFTRVFGTLNAAISAL